MKRIMLFLALAFMLLPQTAVGAAETYEYTGMWPALKQPWYFSDPSGLSTDSSGNVYVVDTLNHRIQKFSSNGAFITKWGSLGSGDGQFGGDGFKGPQGVATDSSGNVYVADTQNHRIQKFNSNGDLITKWGSLGSGDMQFNLPAGIAADGNGYVYVADTQNHRIQKFGSNGSFIAKWGSKGSGDLQFQYPGSIAVDNNGNVYVADTQNHRIQKFNSNGDLITKWGSRGSGEVQFNVPSGIAVDRSGNVYVADRNNYRIQKLSDTGTFMSEWGRQGSGDLQFEYPSGIAVDRSGNVYASDGGGPMLETPFNNRIQKFTADGKFLAKWENSGSGDGQFKEPYGITTDSSGNVYVADTWSNRIQKFNGNGTFTAQWGNKGSGNVQFELPYGTATDSSGNVYVSDRGNHRIQKFGSNGTFIAQWGSKGSGNSQFQYPTGIATDSSDNVYVSDTWNHRIQKFNSNGTFIAKWGSNGSGNGEFSAPKGIATDSSGNVYVADFGNHRIQKFGSNGSFIAKWGSKGSGDLQFQYPGGIAVDNNGNIYVADTFNNRIQKFSRDGTFIAKAGSFGTNPGELNYPYAIAVSSDKVYVVDTINNRIQMFKPSSAATTGTNTGTATKQKAIIVAGGGKYAGNNLWDATQLNANFAYRTLTSQDYTGENIYYLSSDTQLDLNSDGKSDIAGDATNANLQKGITEWAKDAESLVIYMVDHGGPESFRMSQTETLSAADLSTWLDAYQQTTNGKVTFIYDACRSGSFIAKLKGSNRKLITSADTGEAAYFLNTGSLSFSFMFWSQVIAGARTYDAFVIAKNGIGTVRSGSNDQNPQLDADGDGIGNETSDKTLAEADNSYIGAGRKDAGDIPYIGSISRTPESLNGEKTATVTVSGIASAEGIQRVFGIIKAPNFSSDPNTPITDMPTIELTSTDGKTYTGQYKDFSVTGTYTITVYAIDKKGNLSLPLTTTVEQKAGASAGDICAATLSGSGLLHEPYFGLNGAYYWLDLQHAQDAQFPATDIMFDLPLPPANIGIGIVTNTADYSGCQAAELMAIGSDYVVHMPAFASNGSIIPLDLIYVPTTDGKIWFKERI